MAVAFCMMLQLLSPTAIATETGPFLCRGKKDITATVIASSPGLVGLS